MAGEGGQAEIHLKRKMPSWAKIGKNCAIFRKEISLFASKSKINVFEFFSNQVACTVKKNIF